MVLTAVVRHVMGITIIYSEVRYLMVRSLAFLLFLRCYCGVVEIRDLGTSVGFTRLSRFPVITLRPSYRTTDTAAQWPPPAPAS